MSELFADSYPSRWERRCGMHTTLDIVRAVGFLTLAVVILIVVLRLFGPDDPAG